MGIFRFFKNLIKNFYYLLLIHIDQLQLHEFHINGHFYLHKIKLKNLKDNIENKYFLSKRSIAFFYFFFFFIKCAI